MSKQTYNKIVTPVGVSQYCWLNTPDTKFDKENGGGNIYNDASEMTRDEIKYHNFIRRIRTVFN